MKPHLPKQLFTALLAVITLATPAARGELYVKTGGNFWGGSHAFTFTVTEGLLSTTTNTNDVLAYYGGTVTGTDYHVNAYVLNTDSDGNITLSVGDGHFNGTLGSSNTIVDATAFTSQRGADFTTTLTKGETYLVKVTGASGDNGQSVSLYNASTGALLETVSYNGNMNGGDASTTMSSATNASYSADGIYLWNATGSESADFTGSNFWTTPADITGKNVFFANNSSSTYASLVNVTSAVSVANMDVYGSYTFGGTGTLTVTGGLNIAADASATINANTTLSGTLSGTVTNNATLNLVGLTVVSDNLAVTNTGLVNLAGLSKGTNNGDHNFDTYTKQYTSLINAISGGEVILSGSATEAANLTLQLGNNSTPGPSEVNFNADYTSYGDLTLANWSATTTWTVKDSLTVTENLAITNKQKLSIGAGASVTAGSMRLGHYDANADGATLAMTGGMLTTGTILMRGSTSNSSVSITGGSVEFTAGNAISVGQGTPEVSIKGAADAPVILKASQADWTLDGTGLSTSSVIGNVTIAEGNTHGITLKNVNLTGSIVNNKELALGSGVTVAANDEATVTGHKVQILSTLASAGTLNLNASRIYVSEMPHGFVTKDGKSGYSLNGTTIDESGLNGFKLNSGATYYLSENTNVTTNCTNVWLNDTTSYDLVSDESGLYFKVAGTVRSDAYYINSDDVTVNSNVQKLATSYVLQGGNMQLTEGQVSTSAMSYTSGTIELSDGAVLVLDSESGSLTAQNLLTGILSASPSSEGGTPTGKLQIKQNVSLARNTTATYTGVVELVNATLTAGDSQDYSVNISAISEFILNGTSEIYYHANPTADTDIQKITVKGGTGSLYLYDSAGAPMTVGSVDIAADATFKFWSNWHDSALTVKSLTGQGTFRAESSDDRVENPNVTVSSLQGFKGNLEFEKDSVRYLNVEVSTGTAAGVSFNSLTTTNSNGEMDFDFNVQTDTTVGTVSLSGSNNSINLSEGKSLSVGDGTVTNGSFSTGSAVVASKSADTPASLSHVKMTGSGFSAAASANGTKGSISNANVEIAQLAEDATFTIQDMTLTNTTISAATVDTKVNLQNVAATNLALAQGKFTMNAAPTVGIGGTTANFGTNTDSSFMISKLTAGSASLTLNLDVMGAYESTGAVDNVTLTITLAGITGDVSSYGVDAWKALVGFEESSWLGQALVRQKAEYTVVTEQTEQTPATAGESGVPTVSYSAVTVDNVGSLVITIAGLNVPEPATSTLSLLALAALAARRRRK